MLLYENKYFVEKIDIRKNMLKDQKYIKVQFTGTKLMYRLSYKYRLGNLQVSVKK